jgi:hypothetical protein
MLQQPDPAQNNPRYAAVARIEIRQQMPCFMLGIGRNLSLFNALRNVPETQLHGVPPRCNY